MLLGKPLKLKGPVKGQLSALVPQGIARLTKIQNPMFWEDISSLLLTLASVSHFSNIDCHSYGCRGTEGWGRVAGLCTWLLYQSSAASLFIKHSSGFQYLIRFQGTQIVHSDNFLPAWSVEGPTTGVSYSAIFCDIIYVFEFYFFKIKHCHKTLLILFYKIDILLEVAI